MTEEQKANEKNEPETVETNGNENDVKEPRYENGMETVPEVDNTNLKAKPVGLSYKHLYRYAGCQEWTLLVVGSLAAVANGAGYPLLFLFFGELTTQFTEYGALTQSVLDQNISTTNPVTIAAGLATTQFEEDGLRVIYRLLYVSAGVLVVASLQMACWTRQAVSQSHQIRIKYFRAILRQDIAFHDVTSAGVLNTRMSEDVRVIEEGIGDKVSVIIQQTAVIIGCLIVAFLRSYKIALINLAVTPLLGLVTVVFFKVDAYFTSKEMDAYAAAGAIAEQAISSIRTIVAFGCQEKETERYGQNLFEAKQLGMKKESLKGCSLGTIRFIVFSMYGISFWYGTRLVLDGEITPGDFITSFFAVIFASFAIGSIGNNFTYLTAAQTAGAKVFHVIDRIPEIDVFSDDGKTPDDFTSSVDINDVSFHYPTRPSVEVLKQIKLSIDSGQTVAMVGSSGSGKSTVVQLIERFYDPQSGQISIGGEDIKSLNVHWLRSQIGFVSQEPVLFATTIGDNIRWGRDDVTDEEIDEAAKKANAYDFIMAFPKKFDTYVGEGGAQMSGGQKQRIAIARAIVRNPKILLLDEATSALDTESEAIVQAALEKASKGRTTIVIAHRLSTIRGADKIVAFNQGEVMEEGTHEELMEIEKGIYRNLVETQAKNNVKAKKVQKTKVKQEAKKSQRTLRRPSRGFTRMVSERISSEIRKSMRQPASRSSEMRTSATSAAESANVAMENESTEMEAVNVKKRRKTRKRELSEEVEEEVEEEEFYPDVSIGTILSYNKPEWCYITFGCIFALTGGAADPLLALVFGDVLTIFAKTSREEQLNDAAFYGLMFFALAVGVVISYSAEACLFAKSGMELTERLRKATFRAILRQEISYFDDPNHNTGVLCARLATDASKVQGSTGVRLGVMWRNFSSLAVAIGIAFAFSWKLTLLMMVFIPLLGIAGFIQAWAVSGQSDNSTNEEGARIASEAISNVRTIAALCKEKAVYGLFERAQQASTRNALKKAIVAGLAYGYSQIMPFIVFAAVFRLGIHLILEENLPFENTFKVMMAIVYGATAVGQASTFVPDYGEAKTAANRVIGIITQEPIIDPYSDEGDRPTHCKGEVTFKTVYFRYPTRPDQPLLRGLNLSIKTGQTVALVGQSGSGKSTIVQLVERFYDVGSGRILVDGVNMKRLNVAWLRQQIGIVSQEPVLFDQTLAENISFGDCGRQVTNDEITAAARNANIHDFITSLPEKYQTRVGSRGSRLSGGQKQRIAIARALLRNPKILLLDEATSALDAESEKVKSFLMLAKI
ncbi:unnamed protein product [Clavelina lepadiformis]|uniref:Uncharacterized protein n=1 Tax=Clavelina lepadiformis TaxID=159417 RepID=A0ABP0H0B0_CLALP